MALISNATRDGGMKETGQLFLLIEREEAKILMLAMEAFVAANKRNTKAKKLLEQMNNDFSVY